MLLENAIHSKDNPVAALAENWSSPAFERFVDDIKDIVSTYNVQPGSKQWETSQRIWDRVVELEDGFWPNAGDELTLALV